MIAKLIVHAATRRDAAAALAAACGAVEVWPVKTNAGFLARASTHADFVQGGIDTGFMERHAAQIIPGVEPDAAVISAAAAALLPNDRANPWTALTGFRNNAAPDTRVEVEIHGKTPIAQQPITAGTVREIGGEKILFLAGAAWPFSAPRPRSSGETVSGDGVVRAPMPGAVIQIEAARGKHVRRGERLLVLEAMKMEYVLLAPFDGTVTELVVSAGTQVEEGALLARIEKVE
jgi:3-methylcrotonyl-CoA carboxylase alpha subunit